MNEIRKSIPYQGFSWEKPVKYLMRLAFWLGILSLLALIYDIGFERSLPQQKAIIWIYLVALAGGIFFIIARHSLRQNKPRRSVLIADILLALLSVYLIIRLIISFNQGIPERHPWLTLAIILLFIREIGNYRIEVRKQYLNPAHHRIMKKFMA